MTSPNHHSAQPDYVPECTPSFTLEAHIASLHREKTPEQIAQLYRDWEQRS